MKISILCSDPEHPVNEYLHRWIASNSNTHEIRLVRQKAALPGGDLLFLISCAEIVSAVDRRAYRKCLVLHASALPRGRGWNPHIWEIIAGATTLTLTLLEAEDKVDSGRIWAQRHFHVPPHALWDEINKALFDTEMLLMDFALREFDAVDPQEQDLSLGITYYAKREPSDSQIDPAQSIESQFDLIRVCDPKRFPAYFSLRGCRYKIVLEKISE